VSDYDTRLAAYAVIVDDRDRVLLALWNESAEPQWTMPGGGVDLDETLEEGCVREVREETGYDVALGALLGIDTRVVPAALRLSAGERESGRSLKNVRVIFAARVTGGELAREVDGTTDEARWIPLADVPGLKRVSLVDVALGYPRP